MKLNRTCSLFVKKLIIHVHHSTNLECLGIVELFEFLCIKFSFTLCLKPWMLQTIFNCQTATMETKTTEQIENIKYTNNNNTL